MIEPFIRLALRIELVMIMGETAGGNCGAVDHGDHAVNGHLRLDARPVEGRHQRLRQGQAGRLDDDVIGTVLARQQLLHGRNEVVGHRAADAAIVEFDDVVLAAYLVAAALEHVAIHPEIAEFVDDQRNPLALGIGQHVPDQRGLAGAKKAGDHGGGNLGSYHGINPSS